MGEFLIESTCRHQLGVAFRDEERHALFRSQEHGVMAMLAPNQVTLGHTYIVPAECASTPDLWSERTQRAMGILSQATGLWLQAAFVPQYVAELTMPVGPHAMRQRIPVYERTAAAQRHRWLQTLGAPEPRPYVNPTQDQLEAVQARAAFAPAYTQTVNDMLGSIELWSEAHIQRMERLAIALQPEP